MTWEAAAAPLGAPLPSEGAPSTQAQHHTLRQAGGRGGQSGQALTPLLDPPVYSPVAVGVHASPVAPLAQRAALHERPPTHVLHGYDLHAGGPSGR